NNMRTYVLGDEPGLIITAYPVPEKRPKTPLTYGTEVWSGLEYTAAAGMMYEGMEREALKTMTDVRARYDGAKRNPFNEVECGNHYARAMASWSTILAESEFNYSAVERRLSLTAKPGEYFWSTGYSWGSASVQALPAGKSSVKISVHYGTLRVETVALNGLGEAHLPSSTALGEGKSEEFLIGRK
ncbi:MAG TPA: GH116 family glycosyl hydrolase, partial [Bacteroidota bacterium]|nr:GH116 family glycosyl hydrolase [Bacteroidota bacterium]